MVTFYLYGVTSHNVTFFFFYHFWRTLVKPFIVLQLFSPSFSYFLFHSGFMDSFRITNVWLLIYCKLINNGDDSNQNQIKLYLYSTFYT